MKARNILTTTVALGVAAVFLVDRPQQAEGFDPLGFQLSLGQRDFRVFNNFADAATNNNQTPNDQYPGWQGADMAIWKGAAEWGSELHGDGSGDPHQGNLIGSGGANFDAYWAGAATGVGGINDNIFSALNQNGGGTYAFVESPSGNGWRGRYFDHWTWTDGPGGTGNQVDLQGVACHEYGHSLGLSHSNASGATMLPGTFVSTTDNQRSINSDDIAGVQAIYGPKSGSKPRVTSATIQSGLVTIQGTNFSTTGNEVWFTRENATSGSNPFLKVTGASSPSTTSITVSLPSAAGPGAVMVKKGGGTSGAFLSNAYPFDPDGDIGPPPELTINSVSPGTVDQVIVDGSGNNITLTGDEFLTVQNVTYDGIPLLAFPPEFVVVDNNTMTLTSKPASKLGVVDIVIDDGNGNSATTQVTVVANDPPVLEIPQSDPAFIFAALGLEIFMGAEPGDGYLLWISKDLAPTSVPGIFDLDIGNNFSNLLFVTGPLIGGTGWAHAAGNFPNAKSGTVLYWQGTVFKASVGDFPMVKTNVQKTTLL